MFYFLKTTFQDMTKHLGFVRRHDDPPPRPPSPSSGLLSRSGNLREHGCFHARGAGILGSRLSAEKTTAVSGAGAPFSGMGGGGVL